MQGVQQYQPQLFYYFDMDALIPKNHMLRKIDKLVDLGFVRDLTKPYYCQNNGRPSIDPELFFRMLLVGYLYAIESDRQLCDEVQYNLAYRWFCKLNIEDKVPDHSLLTRIRDRFGPSIFDQFFIKIVECCKNMGLVNGQRTMTDGTLFDANASINSLELRDSDSDEFENKVPFRPGIDMPATRKLSNKTHISKTDPDATLVEKIGTKRTLKYKAHITIDADSRVILDAKITKGTTQESTIYINQIKHIQECLNISIKEAIADRGYGTSYNIQSLLDMDINPNIALFNIKSGSYEPSNFIYDQEFNRYICPAGHYLNPSATTNNTITYYPKAADCGTCKLHSTCEGKQMPNRKLRYVTRNIHKNLFDWVNQRTATDKIFRAKLVERMWKMEGLISEAKKLHCLSKAKYRGLNKIQIQAYMIASAINLKRLAAFFILLILYLQNLKPSRSTKPTYYFL